MMVLNAMLLFYSMIDEGNYYIDICYDDYVVVVCENMYNWNFGNLDLENIWLYIDDENNLKRKLKIIFIHGRYCYYWFNSEGNTLEIWKTPNNLYYLLMLVFQIIYMIVVLIKGWRTQI